MFEILRRRKGSGPCHHHGLARNACLGMLVRGLAPLFLFAPSRLEDVGRIGPVCLLYGVRDLDLSFISQAS